MPSTKRPPAVRPSEVFASRLRELRERQRLTQQDLADRLEALGAKTDRATIARTESGSRGIALDDALLYATALNVPLTVLITGPGENPIAVAPKRTATPAEVRDWLKGENPLEGEHKRTYFTETEQVSDEDWLIERHPATRAINYLNANVKAAIRGVDDAHRDVLLNDLAEGDGRLRAEVEMLAAKLIAEKG